MKRGGNERRAKDAEEGSAANDLIVLRPVIAFAGMGALLGMLVGGTTVGFPIAIASAIIGAIGGGILGKFLKIDD
jgi:membrane associated rhomboid family serine protease